MVEERGKEGGMFSLCEELVKIGIDIDGLVTKQKDIHGVD